MKRLIDPSELAAGGGDARKAHATSQDARTRSSDTTGTRRFDGMRSVPLPERADGGATLGVQLLEPVWNPRQECRERAHISYPLEWRRGESNPRGENRRSSALTAPYVQIWSWAATTRVGQTCSFFLTYGRRSVNRSKPRRSIHPGSLPP